LRVWVRRMYMPRTLDHATIEGNGSLRMLWHYFALGGERVYMHQTLASCDRPSFNRAMLNMG